MQWRLHAWCLMGNHYHLCIQTPQPNLVEGMKWLQSAFANKFNRLSKAHGHVFQGRYKAILLDAQAIAPVNSAAAQWERPSCFAWPLLRSTTQRLPHSKASRRSNRPARRRFVAASPSGKVGLPQ